MTDAPSLSTAVFALAGTLERGLGLMEGYSLLQDTVIASLEECDQWRFEPFAPLPGKVDRMTGATQ